MVPRFIVLPYLALAALSAAALAKDDPGSAFEVGARAQAAGCDLPHAAALLAEAAFSLVGLLFGAALVGWVFLASRQMSGWSGPSGATVPGWTPRSWSSNLAIGGALFSSILALAALPERTCLVTRAGYSVLDVTYSAFIALAPAVYGLLKADSAPTPKSAVRLFALAAAITAWGTLGQLLTTAALFLELERAGVIGWPSALAADLLLVGVVAVVMAYTVRCVGGYLRTVPAEGPSQGPRAAREPREWSLL